MLIIFNTSYILEAGSAIYYYFGIDEWNSIADNDFKLFMIDMALCILTVIIPILFLLIMHRRNLK